MHPSLLDFDIHTRYNLQRWLEGHYDPATQEEISRLLRENPQEASDAFYTSLAFGTGGLRGIMGVGPNRINIYTVRAATQGLADYLKKQFPASSHAVFIGCDSRRHSQEFAEETAKVLAGNQIQAYLCSSLRPTPFISFASRHKKCCAAVMITASHNPPEYNGYKVFWQDGGQVLPPHDQGIIDSIATIQGPEKINLATTLDHPLITYVGEELDAVYIAENTQLQLHPDKNQLFGRNLKIVYSSLHGTGITLVPKILSAWGFSQVFLVEEQALPDGNFSTVRSPNPEDPAALQKGIDVLKSLNADLLIATDPDADRVGVAVNHHGEVVLINGNQVACLLLDYICDALTSQNKMPVNGAFIKTIGTTELFQAICDDYKRPCFNVLPGFKYIAQMIRRWEEQPEGPVYIFGGEESCGYLLGTLARDKDGVLSSALIAEMASQAKQQGITLVDKLYGLYSKHGIYAENLLSLTFEESKQGKEAMAENMAHIRSSPPLQIDYTDVIAVEDYLTSQRIEMKTGRKFPLDLPQTNALLFWLSDGSKLMVRPSGTEPKIKLYCGIVHKDKVPIQVGLSEAKARTFRLLEAMQELLK